MRPFVFGSGFPTRITFAAALATIAAGCYGNPNIAGHDAGNDGGTGGSGSGGAGAGGSTSTGGTSATGGSSGSVGTGSAGASGRGGTDASPTGTGGVTGGGGSSGTGGSSGGASDRGGSIGTAGSSGGSGSSGRGGVSGAAGSIGGASATAGSSGSSGRGGASAGFGGRGGGSGIGGGGSGTGGGAIGGMGGSGGSSVGKGLGQSCGGDVECGSGHCASGVCCDQACTGVCKQCSSAGVCQMPADDAACGTITCPTDTTCRDYASAISTNRCKALGQCKGSADCSYVNAPSTTVCEYVHGMAEVAPVACDGMGACRSPTVKCGGDGECAVDHSWCCGGSGGGLTCQVNECGGTPKQGPYLCDEKADCAAGYICCLQTTVGGPSAICVLPSACFSDGGGSRAEACNPANSPSECSTGTCQPAVLGPIGWYVCR